MIAELVTTVALLAESPSVAAESASFWSSASRVSRIARRGARLRDQLREPVLVARAEPDQPFDVEREALVERAQPALRAELEERVGLQPRLLGLAVLAGAGGGLHAVERERDQVVVGLVGLLGPLRRHRALQGALGLRGDALDLLVRGDALLLLGGDARPGARARRGHARRSRCGLRSRLASWSRRSAKAPTAPVRKATASVISKSRVTWSSLTPRPYSTGTSSRNCSSCWARRAASSGVNGAAVKPTRDLSARSSAGAESGGRRQRGERAPTPRARRLRRDPRRSAARGSRSSPRPARRPRRAARGGSP